MMTATTTAPEIVKLFITSLDQVPKNRNSKPPYSHPDIHGTTKKIGAQFKKRRNP
jgi:hypothetical protein